MNLRLSEPGAELFVPDGIDVARALSRTTHLGVGAHPDDLEIMAIHGILECYDDAERWFTGVIATDGAGARQGAPPRSDDLAVTRRAEQKRAAALGRYGAVVLLDHSSREVRERADTALRDDLVTLLRAAAPEVVYTHNLADAHDTHVAVALDLIFACRRLEVSERPKQVIGCEVWRDLDWLPATARLPMPVGDREDLQAALIQAFDSQLSAGKRYDQAALGRRRANATFHEALEADRHAGVVWGMDLTPAAHGAVDPLELVRGHLRAFEGDVEERVERYSR